MNQFEGVPDKAFIVKKNRQDRCVPRCLIAYGDCHLLMGLKAQYDEYVTHDLPFKTFDLTDRNNQGLTDHFSTDRPTGYSVTGLTMSPSMQIIMGISGNKLIAWDPLLQQYEKTLYDSEKSNDLLSDSVGILQCQNLDPGSESGSGSGSGSEDWNIVCCSSDKTIKIINPRTHKIIDILSGHTDFVICVHVVSKSRIISGSSDGTIRIWDKMITPTPGFKFMSSNQWTCTKVLDLHERTRCIESLSSGHIVSASDNGTIRIWDTKIWECTNVFIIDDNDDDYNDENQSVYTTNLIITPDDKILSLSNGILKCWDQKTRVPIILNVQNDDDEYIKIECVTKLWDNKIIGVFENQFDDSYKFMIWR